MTTEHRFTGMHRDGLAYYGTCSCGHAELPCVDKDVAWEEIVDHIIRSVPELRAIQQEAALRRLLGLLP